MITIYRCVLHFYPQAYRNEFGGEMSEVFAELESEVASRSLSARFRFVTRECAGLIVGAMREHWRKFMTRRFSMRAEFRFPKATWILMTMILAGVLMAIGKGEAISVSVPDVSPVLGPIHPASGAMSSWGLSFLLMYAIGVLVGGALFLARSKTTSSAAEMRER